MAKKNYCLDTNILLHNPESIFKFEDNDIYIPYQVIEELDKFKTERTERGFNARCAIRHFSELREMGNLMKGIKMEGGGKLFILYNKDDSALPFSERIKLPEGFDKNKTDNQILLNVKVLQLSTKRKTILVTNDANMQIKADIMDIQSQEYRNDRINPDYEIYGGRSIRYVNDDFFDNFCSMKEKGAAITPPESDSMNGLVCNEFVNLKTWQDKSALAKYNGVSFEKLFYSEITPHPCGLTPRNMGQRFLMEALLSPHTEHPLTIVNGPAGTGKTLFALGCGLHQVMEENKYKRVLLCRANVTMDEDLGYLPGTEMNKIDPLLRGAYDNLEILFSNPDDTPDMADSKKDYLFSKGIIQAQSLAYLRGRSITRTYIIIDEAQNVTPTQMLSIITRAGEGTKIVMMGDVNQIDNPRLDSRNNGLIYALERMKGSKLCEIVSFEESECTRSELAKEAADRLKK